MKKFAFALSAAALLLSSPGLALAQDGGSGGDSGGGGKGGKMKDMVNACRTDAKGKGLKGQEMKQAVMDCVQKQNPKAAGVLKCRMEAKDKGMKPGSDEMKAYVKDCKKNAG